MEFFAAFDLIGLHEAKRNNRFDGHGWHFHFCKGIGRRMDWQKYYWMVGGRGSWRSSLFRDQRLQAKKDTQHYDSKNFTRRLLTSRGTTPV